MWEAASEVLAGRFALDFELLREADDIARRKTAITRAVQLSHPVGRPGRYKTRERRCGSNQPFYQVTSLLLVSAGRWVHKPSEGRVTVPQNPDLTGKLGDLTPEKLCQQGDGNKVPVGEPSFHLVPAVVVWRAQQPPEEKDVRETGAIEG